MGQNVVGSRNFSTKGIELVLALPTKTNYITTFISNSAPCSKFKFKLIKPQLEITVNELFQIVVHAKYYYQTTINLVLSKHQAYCLTDIRKQANEVL